MLDIDAMHFRGYDLNLIVALDALLRERSVTRAARSLHLSQSAMSHALRRLRESIGDPLLVRGGGGLVPTPRAEELHMILSEVLHTLDRALQPRNIPPENLVKTFYVGITDYVEYLIVPKLINDLREEAPSVKLFMLSTDYTRSHDDLINGKLDLVVSFTPRRRPAIHTKNVMSELYSCVTQAGRYPNKILTLQEYIDGSHIAVSRSGRFRAAPDIALEQMGLERQIFVISPHYISAAAIASRSSLILTIQSRIAKKMRADLQIELHHPPFEIPSIDLVMQWSDRTHFDPTHQWLRDKVSNACRSVEDDTNGPPVNRHHEVTPPP